MIGIVDTLQFFLSFFLFKINCVARFICYINDCVRGCDSLAVALIGGTLSLGAILFAVFPIVIEQKNNHNYLGYNISDFLIGNTTENRSISFVWKMCIILTITSIVFSFLNLNFLSLFISIVNIIYLSKYILRCLNLLKNKSYLFEIEREFDSNINSKNIVLDNGKQDIEYDLLTLGYLLRKAENNKQYLQLLNNNINLIVSKYSNSDKAKIYSLVAKSIYKKNKSIIDLEINVSKYSEFISQYVTNENLNTVDEDISAFFLNQLLLLNKDLSTYSYNLINIYKSIDNNHSLHYRDKCRIKDRLLHYIQLCTPSDNSNKSDLKKEGNIKNKFTIYNELISYLLRSKYAYERKFVIELINPDGDIEEIELSILLYYSTLLHLHYLVFDESEKYISIEDKKRYRTILRDIKSNIFINNYNYNPNLDVIDMFKMLENKARDWDILTFEFGHMLASKTPVMLDTYDKNKRALLIHYLSRDLNRDITDYEALAFRNYLNSESQINILREEYNHYCDFLNIVNRIPDDIFNETLTSYLSRIRNYLFKSFCDTMAKIDIDSLNRKIEVFSENLSSSLSSYESLSDNFLMEEYSFDYSLVENISFFDSWLKRSDDLLKIIIEEFYDNIFKKITFNNQLNHYFDSNIIA
nr:hypothetical protein [Bacilli bacterium]